MTEVPKESSWKSLLEIIARLRAPNGCPWDREQTHRSLVPYAIEETYELVEAIESGDDKSIVEELGDVLLQVVLHAQIASETGRFTIDQVIRVISEKMIRRHPHVFGDESTALDKPTTSDQVLSRWQELKSSEKVSSEQSKVSTPATSSGSANSSEGFRFDIPLALPALLRSSKIGDKTSVLKFDWPNWQGVLAKVEEELGEVKTALRESKTPTFIAKDHPETGTSRDPVACEIGDLLFSTAQLARHRGLDPEQCLREANARFERRYGLLREIEAERAAVDGRNWDSRAQDEIESLWRDAKAAELKRK